MRVGSLFTGIGGIDLGLERAGMDIAWQCEIDPYCRKVLAKHWPEVPCYEDVNDLPDDIEPVDLICGGYPCQPFSLAGQRGGADDPRHLWPAFASTLRLLRPEWALLENVPGHLSLGFGTVLSDLAALGYNTEWTCIPAAAVGAPHLRWRIFVVAHTECPGVSADPGVRGRDEGLGDQSRRAPVSARSEVAQPTDALADGGSDAGSEDVAYPQVFTIRPRLRPSRSGGVGRGRPSDGGREGPEDVADPSGDGQLRSEERHGSAAQREGDASLGGDVAGRPDPERGRGDASDRDVADANGTGPQGPEHEQAGRGTGPADGSSERWGAYDWPVEPDVGRVADGIPSRVDRLRTLGNAVVPQVAEFVGRLIMEAAQ